MRRQILNPRPFRRPPERVAQRDHRRERHDDGGNADVGDQTAVDGAKQGADAAGAEHDERQRQIPLGQRRRKSPRRSRRCDPMEMSMWPAARRASCRRPRSAPARSPETDPRGCRGRRTLERRPPARPRAPGSPSPPSFATPQRHVRRPRRDRAPATGFSTASLRRGSSRHASCPPCMTAIRSLMPRISGSSDEIIRIASPSSASICIRA